MNTTRRAAIALTSVCALLLGGCAQTGRRPDRGIAAVARVHDPKSFMFAMEESKLPPGFDKAFILPTSDKDQHRNPVVTRNASQYDQKTGWPYEVWLKEPRMEFVLIPAGEFMMGSPSDENDRDSDEGPVHKVRITRPFYIGKYEVTIAQIVACLKGGGKSDGIDWSDSDCPIQRGDWSYRMKSGSGDYWGNESQPMVEISWHGAAAFCKWLSQTAGVQVSLPTEAQWEYACRAGTRTRFSFGDDLSYSQLGEYAWYWSNSGRKTHPVGQKKPNVWCLYDMHGNVWEWCSSKYASYPYRADDGREELGDGGSRRVGRGGGWFINDYYCRPANRYYYTPTLCTYYLGLRVCVSARAPK